jgi:hypothetical protein
MTSLATNIPDIYFNLAYSTSTTMMNSSGSKLGSNDLTAQTQCTATAFQMKIKYIKPVTFSQLQPKQ